MPLLLSFYNAWSLIAVGRSFSLVKHSFLRSDRDEKAIVFFMQNKEVHLTESFDPAMVCRSDVIRLARQVWARKQAWEVSSPLFSFQHAMLGWQHQVITSRMEQEVGDPGSWHSVSQAYP